MDTIQQPDVDVFKDAARRMSQHLATNGVTLKNTLALETLAFALGAKSYRALKAALNRPAPAEDPDAWKPGQPRFTVHAIYKDNQQRYADYFGGVDALDAAVCCQVDRMADFCSVTIASVVDRVTGKVVDTGWVGDDEIGSHGEAIRCTVDLAKSILSQDAAAPENVAAAVVFLDVEVDEDTVEALNDMFPEGGVAVVAPVTLKAYGLRHEVDPVKAVELVGQYVLDCAQSAPKAWVKLSTDELRNVYHALALTNSFEYQLREVLCAEPEIELVDEALPVGKLAGHPMVPVTWAAIANEEQVFSQGTTYTVAGPTPA